jgi:hypothetical protein
LVERLVWEAKGPFLPEFARVIRWPKTRISKGSAGDLMFSGVIPNPPIFRGAGYKIGLQSNAGGYF